MLPFRRKSGPPAADEPPPDATAALAERLRRQSQRLIETRYPVIVPLRNVYAELRESRQDWAWLLPLLAVVAWRTYRKERRAVVRKREGWRS